ncbi:MAG: hypothetical protein QFF03_02280 [Pseudomonadota bacterium]|nr:hypothetical protein [Pseudomonadota bacterium]
MKAFTLPVLCLSGFASIGASAAVPGADPGEAGVREVENGSSTAFVTGDTSYLDALLDPAYVSVGTRGLARPKAEIIATAKAYATAHPGDQRLRVFRACQSSAPEDGRSRRKAQP